MLKPLWPFQTFSPSSTSWWLLIGPLEPVCWRMGSLFHSFSCLMYNAVYGCHGVQLVCTVPECEEFYRKMNVSKDVFKICHWRLSSILNLFFQTSFEKNIWQALIVMRTPIPLSIVMLRQDKLVKFIIAITAPLDTPHLLWAYLCPDSITAVVQPATPLFYCLWC